MKKTKMLLIAATVAVALGGNSYAAAVCHCMHGNQQGDHFNGPTHCGKGTIANATINGPATLTNTTVSGDAQVNGPTNLREATVEGSLHVRGFLNMHGSTVKNLEVQGPVTLVKTKADTVTVFGPIYAIKSQLGTVAAHGDSVVLKENSSANTITVMDENKHQHKPHVFIENQSKVSGNIVFKGLAGEVFVDNTSTFSGTVTNGKVMKKSSEHSPAAPHHPHAKTHGDKMKATSSDNTSASSIRSGTDTTSSAPATVGSAAVQAPVASGS